MTLYEYLIERYPGRYERTLRTIQRRVQTWKALYGDPKEVMFELRHEPGVMGLSDFTELKQVSITIAGQPFEHILYHYRLAYSGWQYVQVIQGGESFIGLSEGLQNALRLMGGSPQQHRTDSLSAAYRNMAGKRHKPLTQFYDELCDYYGMQPTRNNLKQAHENGSIESPHGHFKRRLRQALDLRGSFDFASVADYQAFIETVITKLNDKCRDKFAEEQCHLQPLPSYRYADYEELTVRVSRHSTIIVRCILYTVPSRLIGRQLSIHLHHDRLVGYWGRQQVVELPRLRTHGSAKIRRARCINYRHVIASLRRKPRAFLYCTWQEELLPNEQWRALWQTLKTDFERDSAARVIVEALYIAATQNNESTVADYLESQLQQETLTLKGLQRHFQLLKDAQLPTLSVQQHPLSPYDQLLSSGPDLSNVSEQSPSASESTTQTTTPLSHAELLANPRTTSDSGAVVLRRVSSGPVRIGGGPTIPSAHQTGPIRSQTPDRQKPGQLQLRPLPQTQTSGPHATGSGNHLVNSGRELSNFRPVGGGENTFGHSVGQSHD